MLHKYAEEFKWTLELLAYREAVYSGNFMAMRWVTWDVPIGFSSKVSRLFELFEEARLER